MKIISDSIPEIQAYFEQNLSSYLELLHRMVAINSFTSNAAGVNALGDLTAEVFAPLGFEAEKVASVNPEFGRHVFLNRVAKNQSSPSLALISHLDTVFPPEEEIRHQFSWREDGRRIYGPGVVDIKGGTVMIIMVLQALQRFTPELFERVHWKIFLNASEETLGEDFGAACLERLDRSTLGCLVFEAGNLTGKKFKVVVARKGRATFQVSANGRSAHSGNNHSNGANAVVQLAQTIQQIAALTDYQKKLTFNVGTVEGGTVVNRVPHFAQAEVEMRTFLPVYFEEGLTAMQALDGSSQVTSADGFACKVAVKVLEKTAPWPNNPLTRKLAETWREAATQLGYIVEEEERGGLSDGNYLWQQYPTLDGLGPSGNNAHCSEHNPAEGKDQEYVTVSSFVPKAVLNILAITRLIEAN